MERVVFVPVLVPTWQDSCRDRRNRAWLWRRNPLSLKLSNVVAPIFFLALPLARYLFAISPSALAFSLRKPRTYVGRDCEAATTTMAPIELARHSGYLARVWALRFPRSPLVPLPED